jgi:hypothetical protein
MKRLVLTGLILAVAASLVGQVEHAPTVAQCQADQRLWLSELEGDTNSITYTALRDWSVEMIDCQKVDPAHEFAYYNTEGEASILQNMRLMHFIKRHGTWDTFLAEDTAGKR